METLLDVRRKTAPQPLPDDSARIQWVQEELAARPALVSAEDTHRLRCLLVKVAAGEATVVRACEYGHDPAEGTAGYIARKLGLLDVLAGTMKMITRKPVIRSACIAGEFAKPRSDPARLLAGYRTASDAMHHLGWWERRPGRSTIDIPVWTSHETAQLDYELPMLRRDDEGRQLLTSTHWPWVGERTHQPDGAHVALLADVVNPVACKIGPDTRVDELLDLCERLDPKREMGRLTFVARLGADAVAEMLPPLVAAVKAAGHPVIWLTDPMHSNTITAPDGFNTRVLGTIVREVEEFQRAVRIGGGILGGLHLETTPDEVSECVHDEAQLGADRDSYASFGDPRLNPSQAISVVTAWQGH